MIRLARMCSSLLALPALVAGCGRGDLGANAPVTATPIETANSRQTGIVMLLNRCPVSDLAAAAPPVLGTETVPIALAAALVPIAVNFTVSAITDYLARVQSERTGTWRAGGAGNFADGPGCLVVMRGRIGTPPGLLPAQGSLSGEMMRSLGLAAPPDFYMEARISAELRPSQLARPGQAPQAPVTDIVLQPQLVQFARTFALRGRQDPKTVGMVLVMRGTPAPNGADAAMAAAGAEIVFPLHFGTIRPGVEIRSAVSGSGSLPGHPLADLAQTLPIQGAPGRVNIVAITTESAEPDQVLRLINATAASQSAGLQQALSTAIQDAIKTALERPAVAR
jgi:hypothetical protein